MRIKSYKEFKQKVNNIPRTGKYLYRGICGKFQLIPSIAYSGETNTNNLLRRSAEAQNRFLSALNEGNLGSGLTPYQLTFLSRHAGLISPYMDFTFNDTVAIQFGIEAAGNNPVHLYVMDTEGFNINSEEDRQLENVEFRIYRPNLVWRTEGLLPQERTQLVQNARLIAQNSKTLAIPLDNTYPDRLARYEIQPEDFDTFMEEIEAEGFKMEEQLLIRPEHTLFQIAARINAEVAIINYNGPDN